MSQMVIYDAPWAATLGPTSESYDLLSRVNDDRPDVQKRIQTAYTVATPSLLLGALAWKATRNPYATGVAMLGGLLLGLWLETGENPLAQKEAPFTQAPYWNAR